MKKFASILKIVGGTVFVFTLISCASQSKNPENTTSNLNSTNTNTNTNSRNANFQAKKIPELQREILNDIDSKTDSLLGKFDFKNYSYPLPRGWQDRDGKELILENGIRRMTEEKIGMSYVTTKFFDVTGDENDEAFVVLKVGTGSITIPQIVYIFEWKEGKPELIWYFRTGDRAAGGLKRIYADGDELIIELFGQDRYIFNKMETSKIVGDEVRLCCPTHFTRNRYKKVGANFTLQKDDRWTFSLVDKDAKPIRNMNDKKLKEDRGSKQ